MQVLRFYVYEHTRRDSGVVFYVGKGTGRRAHVASRHHRSEWWLRTVARSGGFDVRYVSVGLDEELAFLVEVERIDQFRRIGLTLCNLTDGGDGTSGWIKTPEWRAKVGRAHRGKTVPEEVRNRISRAVRATAYKHPDDVRRRMSQSRVGHTYNLGRKQPEAEKRKRAAKLIGNKSRTGQTRSTAERLATSIALAGRKQATVQCPHCGKRGGNAMRRWHFDACKGAPQ